MPVLKRTRLDALSGLEAPALGLVDIESLQILPWEQHNQCSFRDLYRLLIGILPLGLNPYNLLSKQEMQNADPM
ncbi:hypothetical protein [Candidatus Chlamydia corallus]|uniref:hypothetical protein n=1 Tax=Candidatus Chlamydia corallus TaxID=2038470 RepID=UPI000C2FA369|nr:hypothetical protein [Candidatus Chlamydia corallus]